MQQDYAKQSAGVREGGQAAHYDAAKAQAISKQADKALKTNQHQVTVGGQNIIGSANKNKADVQQELNEKHSKSLSELRKEAEQQKDSDKTNKKSD